MQFAVDVDGEWEAYHQKGVQTKVMISNHRISSVERRHIEGTGFRVLINGCEGFAYATDRSRDEEAVQLASKLARVSLQKREIPLPGKYPVVEGLSDSRLREMDADTVRGWGSEMIGGAADRGGHAFYGSLEVTEFSHEITTSWGIQGEFCETLCCAGIDVEVGGFFGSEMLYTRNADSDFYEMGEKAAELASASQNPKRVEGGTMPVILRPRALGTFLEHAVVPSLLADNVDKKTSLFLDRVGEEILPDVTIVDDGTLRGGIGSRPFDGEGCPCKRTPVVEDGVLKSFLFDTTTAAKHHKESTGNAMRSSFCTPPSIYISNLILKPVCKVDELIEDIAYGILVNDIMESFPFDLATGKFVLEGRNVFLIRNGEVGKALEDVTIVGTMGRTFQTLELGDDTRREGFMLIPSGRVDASVLS